MNNTKKKIFFGTGITLTFAMLLGYMWQFLMENHLIGSNDHHTEIFTRATYPNSFLLVVLIPIIATGILFYGIIRKK